MLSHRTLFRGALLGSALALAAFASGAQAANYNVIYSFGASPDGKIPFADLQLDSLGNLYGTTLEGGKVGGGTVWKLAPDGTETVLYSFSGGADGSEPIGGVTVVQSTGDLYGTTGAGGGDLDGTIWHLAPDGTLTSLHDFDYTNTGAVPVGRMVRDKLGNFYGVAEVGGAGGGGTVWKLAADGTFSVLHSFSGADGSDPLASLTRDSAGTLYGTTNGGGPGGYGTVFKVAADGSGFTMLYSFTNGTDGGNPAGALVRDKAGNLYGTAEYGGANGDGTAWKLAPDGTFTTLHTFAGGTDGQNPSGNLLRLGKKLFGTTVSGGSGCDGGGCGTVWKLAPDGTETILHSFAGPPADGYGPYYAGLVKGKDGELYGVTAEGGADGNGIVFSVTKK